jgi:serine/threonine protein phosphatase PrpC
MDHEKDFERIVLLTEELIREIPYHESTTFSCLAILDGSTAGILHTGDSLVLIVDESGDTEQLSRTNHFIVGRCPRLYQAGLVSLARARLVVLATDGLTELARSYGMSVQDFFRRHVDTMTHASVIQSFIDISVNITRRLDDLGAAVALPSSMPFHPAGQDGRVILKKNSKYKVE